MIDDIKTKADLQKFVESEIERALEARLRTLTSQVKQLEGRVKKLE